MGKGKFFSTNSMEKFDKCIGKTLILTPTLHISKVYTETDLE